MSQEPDILLIVPDDRGLSPSLQQALNQSAINWKQRAGFGSIPQELVGAAYAALLIDLSAGSARLLPDFEPWAEQLPILAVFAAGEEQRGEEALALGATDYLTLTQITPTFLNKTIRSMIERRSAEARRMYLQLPMGQAGWSYHFTQKKLKIDKGLLALLGLKTIGQPLELESLLDLILEADRSILEQFIKGLQPDKVQSVHLRRRHPELGVRHYELYVCLYQQVWDLGAYLEGSLKDITKQKRIEQELFKSKERYQIVFTQSKDPIFLSSVEGEFVDFNQSTSELLGYSPKELYQLHVSDLYSNPSDRPVLLKQLYSEGFIRDYPVKLRHKDGQEVAVRITATTVEGKNFKGIHGILRDITQEQRNAALQRAKELAEERVRLKEQFLASISHEIRTPMNAILGMTGLLTATSLSEEQLNYTHSIRQAANSLLQIINNILDAAQMQSGELHLQERPVAIKKLVSSVLNIVKFKAAEKQLDLVLEVGERLQEKILLIDESRLAQVLINLLSNAIKFTDEGQVELIADISTINNLEQLRFQVRDTGDGISKENQKRIFEKFVQVNESLDKRRGGTGLGLAIVKELITLMQGYLELDSKLGQGTTFTLYLPLEYAEQVPTKEEEINQDAISKKENFCVLVAEDNDLNQVVAQRNIESAYPKVEVVVARNGQEVLEQLKQHSVDLILMDLEMPVLDGYEATARIRALDSEKARIPILALTAHRFLTLEKLREKGFDDWISKPFQPKTLLAKIEYYRPLL